MSPFLSKHLLKSFILILVLSGLTSSANGQRRIHVNPTATGSGSGNSWADAYTDLQQAFNDAVAGDSVFVKEGVYKPTTGTDRAASFVLKAGVRFYGGFRGTEELDTNRVATPNRRGPFAYAHTPGPVASAAGTGVSILSGDLGALGDFTDNSYHVVSAVSVAGSEQITEHGQYSPDITPAIALLDGFVVRDGNANGAGPDQNNGGGIFARNSYIFLNDVFVAGNRAANNGGGIYSETSRVTIWLNTRSGNKQEFRDNLAGRDGGAYYLHHTSYFDNLSDILAFTNRAGRNGGGVYVGAAILMAGSLRSGVSQVIQKGTSAGYYEECEAENGGAIYIEGPRNAGQNWFMRDHWFVRCSANRQPGAAPDSVSGYGGGLFANYPKLVATNCIFSNSSALPGNTAYRGGGLALLNRRTDDPNVEANDVAEAMAKLRHLTIINNTAVSANGSGGQGAGIFASDGFTTNNLRVVNTLFWNNIDGFGSLNINRSLYLENTPSSSTDGAFLYSLFQESNISILQSSAGASTFDPQCIYGQDPQLYRVVYPVPMSPATDGGRNVYYPFEPYMPSVTTDEINEDYFGNLRTCIVDIGAVECMRFAIQDGSWTSPATWSPWQTHDLTTNALLTTPILQTPDNAHNVTIENPAVGERTVGIPSASSVFAHNLYFISGRLIMEDQSTLTIRRTFMKLPTSGSAFDPGGEANSPTAGGTVIFENECENYKVRVNNLSGVPQPGLDVRNFTGQLIHNGSITFNNLITRNPDSSPTSPRYGVVNFGGSPIQNGIIKPGLRSEQGGTIFIKRVLDLERGDFGLPANLYLRSTPNYTAMIINRGNGENEVLNVDGINLTSIWMERHVDNYDPGRAAGAGQLGYNYFSSPLANSADATLGVPIAQFANSPATEMPSLRLDSPADPYYWQNPFYVLGNFPNFFHYVEGNNSIFEGGAAPQAGWRCPAPGSNMELARGYCANLPVGRTIQWRGIPNNRSHSINVTRGAAASSGWNLLGNPYPSLLGLDDLLAANSGLLAESTVWRRTATARFAGTWGTYTPGTGGLGTNTGPDADKVQSGQGFFVRAGQDGAFSFTTAMRPGAYAKPRFFRGEEAEKLATFAGLVRLELADGGGLADQAIVYFRSGATGGLDPAYDARKAFFNAAPFPNLFTQVAGEPVAINGLPLDFGGARVPLFARAAGRGRHSIKLDTALYFPGDVGIWLDDLEANTTHDLRAGAYHFQAVSARQDRFVLRFARGRAQGPVAPELALWPNPATHSVTLRFQSDTGSGQALVTITDAFGKVHQQFSLEKGGRVFQVVANVGALPKGIYLVSVRDGQSSLTQRMVKE
jgi:predicted outer membrane repeat protein